MLQHGSHTLRIVRFNKNTPEYMVSEFEERFLEKLYTIQERYISAKPSFKSYTIKGSEDHAVMLDLGEKLVSNVEDQKRLTNIFRTSSISPEFGVVLKSDLSAKSIGIINDLILKYPFVSRIKLTRFKDASAEVDAALETLFNVLGEKCLRLNELSIGILPENAENAFVTQFLRNDSLIFNLSAMRSVSKDMKLKLQDYKKYAILLSDESR
jgi:hypothetical protein